MAGKTIIECQMLLSVAGAFVGMLLLYSGITKLLSLRSFIQNLVLIPYVPYRLAPVLGTAVPIAEAVTGVGLLLDSFPARVGALALFGLFSGAALVAVLREQRVPCNCFGAGDSEPLSIRTIAVNGVLACLVGAALLLAPIPVAFLADLYGFVALTVFLAFGQVVRNHQAFARSSVNLEFS